MSRNDQKIIFAVSFGILAGFLALIVLALTANVISDTEAMLITSVGAMFMSAVLLPLASKRRSTACAKRSA